MAFLRLVRGVKLVAGPSVTFVILSAAKNFVIPEWFITTSNGTAVMKVFRCTQDDRRLTREKKYFAALLAHPKNSPVHLPLPNRCSPLTVGSYQVLYRSGERLGSVTHWQPSTNERCQFLPNRSSGRSGTDDSSTMENSSHPAFLLPTTPAAFRAVASGFFVSANGGRSVASRPARMRMCCCRPCCS